MSGVPDANAFLSTFGTSLGIDAGDPTPVEISSANSFPVTLENSNPRPILAIRVKPFISSSENTIGGVSEQTPNQLRAYPLLLSIAATERTAFRLIKNPITSGETFPAPETGDLSAVNQATVLGTITASTGKVISTFYCGQEDGQTINLSDVFSYNREFLGREAQAGFSDPGDSLYIVAENLTANSSVVTASITWGEQ